jgi:hypothetical protein
MVRILLAVIALTLAMAPHELQQDPPLHSAVTDTPPIVDLTYADPATWGDGVPGLEAATVVRTSSADLECAGVSCVSR